MQYMIVDAHNDIDILCIRTIFIINIIYIYRDDFNINQSWLTSESAAGQDFHKVVLWEGTITAHWVAFHIDSVDCNTSMVAVSSLQRMNVYDLSVIELSARGLLLCAKIKSLDGSKNIYIYIIYIYVFVYNIILTQMWGQVIIFRFWDAEVQTGKDNVRSTCLNTSCDLLIRFHTVYG